ncbi:MAG: dienelactone hydrolase family protein [Bdellovibrionales bacterium]|nr:dienelactone hydrolase family protein [Bdellovibrionales bacterium]
MEKIKIPFKHQWIAPQLSRVRRPRLVIVFHGRGDSIKPFHSIQDELNLKDHAFLLLQGPRKFQDGFSWCAVEPHEKKSLEKVCGQLSELLEMLAKLGWDSSSIVLLGFSQGAMVASHFALKSGFTFAGVVGVSGYFYFEKSRAQKVGAAARKTPWLMTHGRQDDVIPIEDTRQDVSRMKELGLKIRFRAFEKGHHFEEQSELPAIKNWILSTRPS